ncbi:hypothetical protein [Paenibacillus macerans]|uniref:hypothetical protein n=1 Tax=Paenibacillus macerans TaxID=44252 RepID=UPI003D31FD65
MEFIIKYFKLLREQNVQGNISRLVTTVLVYPVIFNFLSLQFVQETFIGSVLWIKLFIITATILWLFLQAGEFIYYAVNGLLKKSVELLIFQIALLLLVFNFSFGVVYFLFFDLIGTDTNMINSIYAAFSINYSLPLNSALDNLFTSNYLLMITSSIQIIISKGLEIIVIGVLASIVIDNFTNRQK